MIRALGYFLSEALASLWRGRRASALSVATIAIGLFVLGVFLVATTNIEQWLSRWSGAAEFSVYLEDGITDAQRDRLVRAARTASVVAAVDHVSKAEALRRFARDFPDLGAAARSSPRNPIPASLEVRLVSAAVEVGAVERLARSLQALPGVSDVRYDRRWLERLASIARGVRWAGIVLSAVLILAAALTIASVVRLALFARRDEVEIMELVGAPTAFIRGPFVCEGVLHGALGAAVSLIALRVAFAVARPGLDAVAQLAGAPGARFLSAGAVLLVLAGGAMVGCLGSLFAVRRFR